MSEKLSHERISLQDVYLGQGVILSSTAWKTLRDYKPITTFAAGVAQVIWKANIAYFCLDLKKVKKIIPGERPIKLFCPNKLELFFGELLPLIFVSSLLISNISNYY